MSYQGNINEDNFLKNGFCSCGNTEKNKYLKNMYCYNYQLYGYNCLGVRVSFSGNILSNPGLSNTKYHPGPKFGGIYIKNHPDEFKE